MWFKNGQPFYFEAPDGMNGQKRIFPTVEHQAKDFAAVITATILAQTTLIEVAEMNNNATLNLDVHSQVQIGATLIVMAKSDATGRNITLGTGFLGTSISGTAAKTKVAMFFYDGSKFIHISTNQVD